MTHQKNLKPVTDEERKLAETPEGMRKLIQLHQYDSVLVYNALRMAEWHKLNELDAMTVLAFESILCLEETQTLCLERAMNDLRIPVVLKNGKAM
jgi:hypothetical protein